MGFREFVGLIAALMAITALGIDSMLPALPQMGSALGIASENQRQWIIAAYMLGLGSAQLAYGPLADRFGRKPVLIAGLSLFTLFSILAGFATNFETIVIARALQGIGAAAPRVLAVSVVRDCYSGRQMARVMSLSFIIFLAVPILAPSIGQIILFLAPWPYIFFFLATFGAMVVLWAALRMRETLHPEHRRPIAPAQVLAATRIVLGQRISLGYSLAVTCLFGALMGFINSVQQIFADVFHAERLFTLIFALAASFMGIASFVNARFVEHLGTRLLSHGALVGFVLVALLHGLCAMLGLETIWSFALLQCAQMFCFGLVTSNFSAMAMEPVGHVAGTASSVQGFMSTVGGALIGIVIGQKFDGTTVPVTMGFLLVGIAALLIVMLTEKGRLFRPHVQPA
ncbi:MFS transporter [Sphingomonas oleivorans]|uniref:MFS transporter n=2 Tax=Sphingomonas oleivorans TaxID=1735121 RepID=A0A2T5FX31_9SPHN|nr:MFS transporter [Sphingomonas oleivorans]